MLFYLGKHEFLLIAIVAVLLIGLPWIGLIVMRLTRRRARRRRGEAIVDGSSGT